MPPQLPRIAVLTEAVAAGLIVVISVKPVSGIVPRVWRTIDDVPLKLAAVLASPACRLVAPRVTLACWPEAA